ncbi:MAG: heavy metal sensor histidine kinase, partial [Rhodoferax sp.]|nr:heavy metal sensor histidine kinase [Rhodoferax sp.]
QTRDVYQPYTVRVAIAADMAHHQDYLRSLLETLWIFVVSATLLIALLGWAAVRRGLRPLRTMREQTSRVTAQQLGHRLPVQAVPQELAELAQSLNDMLARLEEAFARLTAFSSDIAHELRTPVSNLMTQTQVVLSQPRSAPDYKGVLESNSEELDRMARMIADMLLLAKADNGLVLPQREAVELGAEVQALFDYFEAVADEKQLQLALGGSATVPADRPMLRRAIANLLSNAIRHATPGSTVQVVLTNTTQTTSIRVTNRGDTLPPELLERIFDRFFRADPARARSSEGTGLGLAITRSIVLAHGGRITASSGDGITTLVIDLPRASAAATLNAAAPAPV